MINKKIIVLLAAVVMITFPLFVGWIPLFGEFIPKVLVLVYVVIFASYLMSNKAFTCLVVFYLYVILQSMALGYGFDFISWFANFMNYALPVLLLQAAIKYDNEKTVNVLAKFSIVFIFVTVVLSILVMLRDPGAMRYQQGLIIQGELAMANVFRQQGLASYSFAAMIMCMPAVLISIVKSSTIKKIKPLAIIGIVLSLIFMWMGQVTTTLLICICLAFVSFFIKNKSSNGMIVGGLLLIVIVGLFGGGIIDAVRPYTEGTAMEAKFDNFNAMSHGGVDETEEGSVQGRLSLTELTLNVFIQNPLFGDCHGYIGGHNFLIDRFALYGILGAIPFFFMLFYSYKMALDYLPKEKHSIYKLIFAGFIALGLLKNMSGMEYWLFMFCFYPFILKYSSSLLNHKIKPV